MTHAVRIATRTDLGVIADTHGAAFEHDPVARWLVGEARVTTRRIGRLYRALAAGHLDDGLSFITPGGEAASVWAAPKRYKIPTRQLVRNIPDMVGAVGIAGMGRLMAGAEVEKLHPPEPHYYLAALGTRPADQAKGYASATMEPVLDQADSIQTGCFLESSTEDNLAFYARHGFEVTGTHDLAGGKGPRLWLMWRGPRPG